MHHKYTLPDLKHDQVEDSTDCSTSVPLTHKHLMYHSSAMFLHWEGPEGEEFVNTGWHKYERAGEVLLPRCC